MKIGVIGVISGQITQKNIERLEDIVAYYAMQDYKRANPNPKMRKNGTVIHNPYSLSPATNEARAMLASAIAGENVEEVKAYLLKHKMLYDL